MERALLWGHTASAAGPSDAPLEPLFLPSEQSSGLRACLGSRGAHGSSSLRLCSMTTTTPTPSTACARCYENSWSRPRGGCSMPPSLPRKFGERGNGLFICPCRHYPNLTLSPKLTLRGDPGHSFWRWMCWSGEVVQLCLTEGGTFKSLELAIPGLISAAEFWELVH